MNDVFGFYINYGDNETLARIYLPDGDQPNSIPLNFSLDSESVMDLEPYEICTAGFWSDDYEVTVYKSEEEFSRVETNFAPKSMIPMGTFASGDEGQNAFIMFTGTVTDVLKNPEWTEGRPRMLIHIETYALEFDLIYYEDDDIKPGYLLHGRAWLYGHLERAAAPEDSDGETEAEKQ